MPFDGSHIHRQQQQQNIKRMNHCWLNVSNMVSASNLWPTLRTVPYWNDENEINFYPEVRMNFIIYAEMKSNYCKEWKKGATNERKKKSAEALSNHSCNVMNIILMLSEWGDLNLTMYQNAREVKMNLFLVSFFFISCACVCVCLPMFKSRAYCPQWIYNTRRLLTKVTELHFSIINTKLNFTLFQN